MHVFYVFKHLKHYYYNYYNHNNKSLCLLNIGIVKQNTW